MSKRYGELADALDELALHHRLDGRDRLARDYQLAASSLRTAEIIPPDPAELSDVSARTRDSIAEWRAFGRIEELQTLRDKRPYLKELTSVKSLGPKTAKSIHEELGVETLSELETHLEDGTITEVHGIGSKTATTFRRSVAQLDRNS